MLLHQSDILTLGEAKVRHLGFKTNVFFFILNQIQHCESYSVHAGLTF